MNCLPCFLMDKIELKQGDRTLETIRDLDIWFDQNVYTAHRLGKLLSGTEVERYSESYKSQRS